MKLAVAVALITTGAITTGAAAQGCPTAADLETGITLYDSSNDIRATHQTENDVFIIDLTKPIGDAYITFSTSAPHPLALPDHLPIGGARYNGSLTGLDRLDDGDEWSKTFTIFIQRTASARGDHTLVLDRSGTFTLGKCVYDVLILNEIFTMRDGTTHTAQRTYAPDLGIVIAQSERASIGFELSEAFVFDEIVAE